jgi:multidrug efflux system outer membrane protein
MIFALLLGGCALGPDYKRPAVTPPPAFRSDAQNLTNSLGDTPWWQLFQDETLQSLIRVALTNNYDVRIAASRVEQARAVLMETRSQYFPQATYGGSVGAGRNVLAGQPYQEGGAFGKGYSIAGMASWEIDLWGRIRRLNESSRAQFLATTEARTNVMVSLIATVASDYFQLLALDKELQIARDTTNSFGESLRIFSDRLRGGVSSRLETASAEALEAAAAATVPELERQITVEENQIRILLGLNPGPIVRNRKLLDESLAPDVPAGLPSALLQRRPDIRQAELLVRSANAQIGSAKADFFPKLSLTALFGQTSPELSTLTGGAANAWNVTSGLSGPLFNGGLLRGQYHYAKAQWEESVLQYQSTVLNALQEVGNALVARQQLARERVEQTHAVRSYEEAVQVANERYKAGQANYYELLQEQQLLFPAENVLAQTELNQLLAVVQLYQALGGGWQNPAK